MSRANPDTPSMALFCDFENVALGVEDAKYDRFDIGLVLERLLLKGSIVVKKAYCDWARYRAFKPAMHQASFELIEIPHVRQSGKNSADIRLVVDALDLCYTKSHVDTFVIISGDSDFSPLVSKLRENDKTVIGVGVRNSTSDLLIANCDEFIFYDDLVKALPPKPRARRRAGTPGTTAAGAAPASAGAANGDRVVEPAPTDDATTAAQAPAPAGGRARKSRTTGTATKAGAKGARGAKVARAAAAAAEPSSAATAGAEPAKSARTRGAGRKRAATMATTAASEAAEDDSAIAIAGGDAGESAQAPAIAQAPLRDDAASDAIDLVMRTIEAIASERGDERIWGSMVKQTLKRQNPGFNERAYGYRSFNGLLEEAAARQLIDLERDEKSGGYVLRLA